MFVYLTYCYENGKSYIGKYEGKETDNYLGSGKLLKRAIKKYGSGKFKRVVLERHSNVKDCREGEKKWIKLFNADTSRRFYNIAKGGEGGDTYSGLSDEDRITLQVKLKNRKTRNPPTDQVAYINLLDNTTGSCSSAYYYEDCFKVGVKCKGIYKTPLGNFSSLKTAHSYINIDMASLRNRCTNPGKAINNHVIGTSDHLLVEHDKKYINHTFLEAGYSFIPIETFINWSKKEIKQLNIIKK